MQTVTLGLVLVAVAAVRHDLGGPTAAVRIFSSALAAGVVLLARLQVAMRRRRPAVGQRASAPEPPTS